MVERRGDLIAERDPRRPSAWLLRQCDMDASYVDLADPLHLEFDYLRWIRIVLRTARARKILHVGGGACALPRALAAEDPAGRQEVCEIDADVLAIAREHLGLRRTPGLRVRHAEGRAFIAGQPDGAFDAIVIDAFVGAAVPRRLITAEAFCDVARVTPIALINVVDNRAAREVRTIAAGLAEAYPRVCALGGRAGNTVVIGSVVALDLTRIAARAAADPSPARLTPPPAMARRVAGTPPLRDEDCRAQILVRAGSTDRGECPRTRRATTWRRGHMAVDLVIDVENSPGALAQVASAISDAGVNIAAATCVGPGARAELHILVKHAEAAKHSLAISQLAITREREVVVVDVEDRPGVLADLTRKVAKAGVDLDLVYVATRNRVVFGAADLEALKAALA